MTRAVRSGDSGHVKSDSVQHTEVGMSSADWGSLMTTPYQLGKAKMLLETLTSSLSSSARTLAIGYTPLSCSLMQKCPVLGIPL